MLVAGLTGNYGMGKSTVLAMFRELGAITIDADTIVDALLRDASVLNKIRHILGEGVFLKDGSLDKARVAGIIFRDKALRDEIEAILHPLVFKKIEDMLRKLAVEGPADTVAILEIPLLFERGYSDNVQRRITVYTDRETAIRRLAQSGVDRDSALSRLDAQLPIEEKIERADFAIDNNGTVETTRTRVAEVYGTLMQELAESMR